MKRTAIVQKAKPCKINSKAINFQGCGKMTFKRTKGLCDECYYRKFLPDTPEGQAIINKVSKPLVQKREDFTAAKRDFEERKTIPALLSNAQIAVNAYIRKRDEGLPCISCGCEWKSDFDAGHAFSAAKFPRMRFDEWNENGQCIQCNRMKEGNYEMYRMGYEQRFGAEKLAELDEKARLDKLQGVHKWQREELIRITKYFKAKLALIKTK